MGVDFTSLLATDPCIWNALETYKKGLIRIKGLQVINDCAECGVGLISQYNEILTKNEEQRQYLLKVVQQHRKIQNSMEIIAYSNEYRLRIHCSKITELFPSTFCNAFTCYYIILLTVVLYIMLTFS